MPEDRGVISSWLSSGDRGWISPGRHSVRWQPITPAAGGAMAQGMYGAFDDCVNRDGLSVTVHVSGMVRNSTLRWGFAH